MRALSYLPECYWPLKWISDLNERREGIVCLKQIHCVMMQMQ